MFWDSYCDNAKNQVQPMGMCPADTASGPWKRQVPCASDIALPPGVRDESWRRGIELGLQGEGQGDARSLQEARVCVKRDRDLQA